MQKRLSKLALLAVAAAFMVAGFPACSDDDEDEPTPVLESIQVQTNPTQTAYTVGDTALDPAGLVIKEIYDIGDPHDVAFSEENKGDFQFDFDFSKAGETVTVTVTYKEKTTTFTVSVVANGADPTKTLASIAVKTKPTKAAYTVGETFEPAGLVITATYAEGGSDPIAYGEANKSDFSFSGFNDSKAGDVTITVTYKEMTTTFTVSVAAKGTDPTKTLASIAVKTKPTKAAYTVGETFEPAGLVITATYAEGGSDPIAYGEANKGDFSFSGFDATKVGDVTVTVTYKEKTATFTVTVAEKKGDEEKEPDPTEPTLFEKLSAQENNILKQDFAAFTVSPFGAGFGKVDVYGDDGVTVADGAISTGAAGKNRKIYVDFGPVKDVVEGCVTLRVTGATKEGDVQADKNLLTFLNGDSALLTIKTGTGDNTVSGTAGTYEIYYKFDLTEKKVSLTVNGKAVLTDSALTADSVSGYTIESHNSGKGTVTADDIAVCATEGDLGTYKAQVKAWLATLVENKYSDGYTMNKSAVDQAKNVGDSAIDSAADIDAVLAAYGDAKTALGNVKSDLEQKKADACTELDAYFPEGKTYTGEKLKAVEAAKEAGKTAINAATKTNDVETALAKAKEAINALPDDNATAYTVTVKDSDGNDLGTVTAYTTVESVLDEIKKLITDPTKVIAGGKFYTDQACATEYDIKTELTGDVTVYVTLEEKKTTTYVLDASTATFAEDKSTEIDGMKFEINTSKSVPDKQGIFQVINMQGGVKTDGNYIKFTTTQTASVTVSFFHSKADRYVKILQADGSAAGTGSEKTTDDSGIKETTFTNLPAGTYYLGSGSSGIYISKVTVTTE